MGPEQTVLRWQQGPEEGQAGYERDPWGPPASSAQPRDSSHFMLQGSPPPHSRTTAWPLPLREGSLGQVRGLPVPSSCLAPPPSALLQAFAGLHHGVAPLAHGELPAKEGRGAFRFHSLDLLAC